MTLKDWSGLQSFVVTIHEGTRKFQSEANRDVLACIVKWSSFQEMEIVEKDACGPF